MDRNAIKDGEMVEAASGFEPLNRGFAERDRGFEQVDHVRPTRLGPHQISTLRGSSPTPAQAHANALGLVWGKVGASPPTRSHRRRRVLGQRDARLVKRRDYERTKVRIAANAAVHSDRLDDAPAFRFTSKLYLDVTLGVLVPSPAG